MSETVPPAVGEDVDTNSLTSRVGSAVIETAARERRLVAERMNESLLLVWHADRPLAFTDMNGPASSPLAKNVCRNVAWQHALIGSIGLPVPDRATFGRLQYPAALAFAEAIGWPVAVRPGIPVLRGTTENVRSGDRFRVAWRRARQVFDRSGSEGRIVVEADAQGEDLLLFVVDGTVVSAVRHVPAAVVGDGVSTIGDLIRMKNTERAANPVLRTHLIPESGDRLDALTASGGQVTDVPSPGRRMGLVSSSGVRAGGDVVDVTDDVEPAIAQAAVQSIRAIPGLQYGGVEVTISPEVRGEGRVAFIVRRVRYASPPLGMFPTEGTPRDVSGAILDYYISRTCVARTL